MLVLFLTCLLFTPVVNATAFDSLQKQLQNEINRSSAQTKTTNSTVSKNTVNTTKNASTLPVISVIGGTANFQSWDYYNLAQTMGNINNNIIDKCKIITQEQNSHTIEYKINFNKSTPQKISITKSSGYKYADDLVVNTLTKYFNKYKPETLNEDKPFIFKGRLTTIPITKYTPIYILEDELKTVPEEQKEYFASLNKKLEEAYKNSNNVEGEALILLKFGKDGQLISTNQTELVQEFVKSYNYDLNLPKMSEVMVNELILSAQSVFPIEPLNASYNQVIVMKVFKATKTPFIKPTDKLITKIGKGALVGIGTVVAIPFVILGSIVSGT